jgi:hypothetical protein
VTPKGNTRVKRNTVIAHKTYFEQFAKRLVARVRLRRGRERGSGGQMAESDADGTSMQDSSRSFSQAPDVPSSERARRQPPLVAPRGSIGGKAEAEADGGGGAPGDARLASLDRRRPDAARGYAYRD